MMFITLSDSKTFNMSAIQVILQRRVDCALIRPLLSECCGDALLEVRFSRRLVDNNLQLLYLLKRKVREELL